MLQVVFLVQVHGEVECTFLGMLNLNQTLKLNVMVFLELLPAWLSSEVLEFLKQTMGNWVPFPKSRDGNSSLISRENVSTSKLFLIDSNTQGSFSFPSWCVCNELDHFDSTIMGSRICTTKAIGLEAPNGHRNLINTKRARGVVGGHSIKDSW